MTDSAWHTTGLQQKYIRSGMFLIRHSDARVDGICPGNPKGRITAGAVSAALRELRPVEIVGLYEAAMDDLQVGLQLRSTMYLACNMAPQVYTPHEIACRLISGLTLSAPAVACPYSQW